MSVLQIGQQMAKLDFEWTGRLGNPTLLQKLNHSVGRLITLALRQTRTPPLALRSAGISATQLRSSPQSNPARPDQTTATHRPTSVMLTQPEIEALRQNANETMAYAKKAFAKPSKME